MLSCDELIAFEDQIAKEFNEGKIPYPVHLSDGNEDQLIEIFEEVEPDDWIFGSWRLHYHALLKGVSQQDLRAAIHRGESMALSFPEHRVFGSAIVGGIIPIALGVAMSIARKPKKRLKDVPLQTYPGGINVYVERPRVWCFIGDMSAEAGIFHECFKYANNHNLPIEFVIEDNGISVLTDTQEVWGQRRGIQDPEIIRYKYQSKYPHAGAGKRVQF